MKPFNLELALAGDPILYKDEIAKLVYVSQKQSEQTYLIVIINDSKESSVWTTKNDLFMAPIKKKYFVNAYKGDKGKIFLGKVWNTEVPYKTNKGYPCVKKIEFEIEE